jgi:hypothetical protein
MFTKQININDSILNFIVEFELHYTTRKLKNINKNFLSVNCGELYLHNSPSLYPLVNTDKNIPLIYIKGIIVRQKGIKKKSQNIQ